MKKLLLKLLGIIVIVLIILMVGLHIFLQVRLTDILKKAAIPEAEKALGVDISLGHADLNIFRGSLSLSDLQVGNPSAFQEPSVFAMESCDLDVNMIPLLGKVVEISKASLENAIITIVRSAENEVNAVTIQKQVQTQFPAAEQTSEKDAPKTTDQSTEPGEIPALVLGDLDITLLTRYVDHKISTNVFELGLNTTIKANNVRTIGSVEDEWGTFVLNTHLTNNADLFVTDLKCRIAPITNPLTASFDIEGSIKAIDMKALDAYAEDIGIRSESLSLTVKLKCRNGVFDRPNSPITLTFHKPQPAGKLARKLKHFPTLEFFAIPLYIGGTIEKLDYGEWDEILFAALETNALGNLKPLLKSASDEQLGKASKKINEKFNELLDDAKVEDQIKKAKDKLGDFFK
jgi:hypothetical protein